MRVINALLGFGGHGYLNPSYVCVHETAGPGAPAINLVNWWRGGGGLPVHYVGDWTGDCYYCVPEDEVCWQVGNGNPYVVGIELCHATNQADFNAVWELGVEWAAWQLSKRGWGIDRLLSHYDCTLKWGGSDHTDPIGYFEEFGRSWDEFKQDVKERMEDDDMRPADVWEYNYENSAPGGNMYNCMLGINSKLDELTKKVNTLQAEVKKIKVGGVDVAAVAKAVNDDTAKRMKQ